ncbi:MAG: ATP-binding cassette domain-containing protein [Propionibacteriales bacterium]|nr:ATP-binding cassette domain-containing protein [Propionibacteriales bacterium]
MISCHDVTKSYRGRTVVDHVTFDVPAGQVTGFLGPNGSGKTTTMRGILGLTGLDSGTVVVETDTAAVPGSRPLGATLDCMGFRRELRIEHALDAVGRRHGATTPPRELLEQVGLDDPRMRVGELSLGMMQRLRIAAALVVPARALVLDEPLNGLDPDGVRWVRGLVREHADAGGAVLVSSHLLNEAERLVDRVVVIHRGSIIAENTLQGFTQHHASLEDAFFASTARTTGDRA